MLVTSVPSHPLPHPLVSEGPSSAGVDGGPVHGRGTLRGAGLGHLEVLVLTICVHAVEEVPEHRSADAQNEEYTGSDMMP